MGSNGERGAMTTHAEGPAGAGEPITILYRANAWRGEAWQRLFAERAPEYRLRIWPDAGDPAAVQYLCAWLLPPEPLSVFPNLKALFCVAAGVDQLDLARVPPNLPVVRMIEPGLRNGMIEYTCWAALALHREIPGFQRHQRAEVWDERPGTVASKRRIGVLGMGVLGRAVLEKLHGFGFDCAGWSRSRHALPGVAAYAGVEELPAFLARTDILICLLPLTGETRGMLDAKLFAMLPRGASLVHVGRGPQLVADDLRAALDSGQLGHAIVDVCDPEPLPPGHWLWQHPKVWLTPHIASMSQPESAFEVLLENLRRHRAGEPMHGQVDRTRGY